MFSCALLIGFECKCFSRKCSICLNFYFRILRFIPAKLNKGLIIGVIPKFVEGLYAKYVTGSGQTVQTADRVHIYETEGNVKPCRRNIAGRKKEAVAVGAVKKGSKVKVKNKETRAFIKRINGKKGAASVALAPKVLRSHSLDEPIGPLAIQIPAAPDGFLSQEKPGSAGGSRRRTPVSDGDKFNVRPYLTRQTSGSSVNNDGDRSPPVFRPRLMREVTWGGGINTKKGNLTDLSLIPPAHNTYHFSGEDMMAPEVFEDFN
jgi:hypothetical protein